METFSAGSLGLFGGRLCLDFVNTANRSSVGIDREFLCNCDDLMGWGRSVGLLTANTGAREHAGSDALGACLALRESLHRLLGSGCSKAPADADLERLNEALALGARHGRLVASEERVTYAVDDDPLAWLAGPVAWSASELLTSAQIEHVKTCPGPRCGWLFLDTSRGHPRRWCSMTTCGNRSKARAHYERQQGAT